MTLQTATPLPVRQSFNPVDQLCDVAASQPFAGSNLLTRVLASALGEIAAMQAGQRQAHRIGRIGLPYQLLPGGLVTNRAGLPVGLELVDVLLPHINVDAFGAWVLSPAAFARVVAARAGWEAPRARSRLFTDGTAPWTSKSSLEDYRVRLQVFRDAVVGADHA